MKILLDEKLKNIETIIHSSSLKDNPELIKTITNKMDKEFVKESKLPKFRKTIHDLETEMSDLQTTITVTSNHTKILFEQHIDGVSKMMKTFTESLNNQTMNRIEETTLTY
eukprot:UN29146